MTGEDTPQERDTKAKVLAEDRLVKAEDLAREMRVFRIQMWLAQAGLFALILWKQ